MTTTRKPNLYKHIRRALAEWGRTDPARQRDWDLADTSEAVQRCSQAETVALNAVREALFSALALAVLFALRPWCLYVRGDDPLEKAIFSWPRALAASALICGVIVVVCVNGPALARLVRGEESVIP